MVEQLLLILIFVLLLVLGVGFFWLLNSRLGGARKEQDSESRIMLEVQRELGALRQGLNEQMLGLFSQMNEQIARNTTLFSETQQHYQAAIGQVQNRLGELQHATQSMIDIGKDISSLQDILQAPKLRGGLGELFLGELLRQILPQENYALQHSFREGGKVDAVIFMGEQLLAIDAKFPLENFKRILNAESEDDKTTSRKQFYQDVKKHIDSIASKYILPEEGTFDFAMMYIPAENVYYEVILKQESRKESLSDYALEKRIVPVSPNSLYAYLQAIVRGLKGMRIERSAQMILSHLGQLEADFNKIMVDFEKVGTHLSNAQSAYEKAFRGFDRVRTRLSALDSDEKSLLVNGKKEKSLSEK